METRKVIAIEYMCSYCGKKETKGVAFGRPMPGVCTKRGKTLTGATLPHRWVINRKKLSTN